MVAPMKLKAYLEKEEMSQTDFAKKVKASIGAVNRWVHLQQFPEKQWLRKIKAATDGEVQPNDFL